jgi:hypothetical protein
LEPEINNNSSSPINQPLLANKNAIQKKPGLIKPANAHINKLSANTVTEENKNAVAAEMKEKNIQSNESGQPNVHIATNENKVDETIAVNEQKQKDEHQDEMNVKKSSERKNKQSRNGLSFFVSAGPDISKAGSSKAGKVTLTYGIGAAYTINRFTIKTGIFEAKKIYWANPDEYKLSWTPPNVKFEGADANCRVVEIPLKVSYNFGFTNKSNWFAGAGLSSYLMKDEKYVLEYKTSTGAPYYHPYEAKNENKHYFSILDISAGYSLQLNKTFTISAEPYLEIPMSGIGAGKIHLNSGGILFTLGVSPFRK